MSEQLRVDIDDGKYTFIKDEDDWRVRILRHGEPWATVEKGVNAVLPLMYRLEELNGKRHRAYELVRKLIQKRRKLRAKNRWLRARLVVAESRIGDLEHYAREAHDRLAGGTPHLAEDGCGCIVCLGDAVLEG